MKPTIYISGKKLQIKGIYTTWEKAYMIAKQNKQKNNKYRYFISKNYQHGYILYANQ